MSRLTFRLFGRFEVWRDRQPLTGLVSGKSRELLCYLLLHRQHPHSREALADLLWADKSGPQARRYLRKAIWQLRTALNCNEATTGHGLLIADRDWLAVKLGESTTFDVADFEDTLASTRWNRPLEISEQQVQTLKAAANLYGGDLLKGCYQDWCLYERERLQNLYLSMLNTVVAYGEAHGLHQDVIDYGERLLSREPSHELTHQRLIRTYFAMSDRTGALRQYKRCCLALTNELGVSPSQSTLDLFQGAPLHGVEVPPSISLPPREVIAAATLPNWNSILGKLDDVIKALSHLRRVLGRELP